MGSWGSSFPSQWIRHPLIGCVPNFQPLPRNEKISKKPNILQGYSLGILTSFEPNIQSYNLFPKLSWALFEPSFTKFITSNQAPSHGLCAKFSAPSKK